MKWELVLSLYSVVTLVYTLKCLFNFLIDNMSCIQDIIKRKEVLAKNTLTPHPSSYMNVISSTEAADLEGSKIPNP